MGVRGAYEGTHKGCPYGWIGEEGDRDAYEGTHEGCPYGAGAKLSGGAGVFVGDDIS